MHGLRRKRLDPLAFQQAPNQKRVVWRLASIQCCACMFIMLKTVISRTDLCLDLHLIKGSLFNLLCAGEC